MGFTGGEPSPVNLLTNSTTPLGPHFAGLKSSMSPQKRSWSAICALTLVLSGCSGGASHELTTLPPQPGNQTTAWITIGPHRAIDLVFVIDNSPSMAAKQSKLKIGLSMLLRTFRDPSSGAFPDLRVAMISADLGTGGAYRDGPCAVKTLPDGTRSVYGDLGRFQMVGAAGCGVTDPAALWLETRDGVPANFEGDIGDVFACLAAHLGTQGCEVKQPLQALEFALVAQGWGNEAQRSMLRPDAHLAIAIITDEDDCSASTNDGMFGDKPELRGEAASLRCATRAYTCGGNNLSTLGPGFPTTQAFSAPLYACTARTDACPNSTDGLSYTDTSLPTECSPLKSVAGLAAEIKGLKEDPILVAGIFGWPVSGRDGKTDWPHAAEYRVAPIPNPNVADPAHPQIYAQWPTCYDRTHLPASADVFDPGAAALGAKAGLRIAAFIDQFGEIGLKTSICEDGPSLATALDYGSDLVIHLSTLCIDDKLFDTDRATDGLQADCRVVLRRPETDPANPEKLVYREDAASMPRCDPSLSVDEQPTYPCWRVLVDRVRCPVNGQQIDVVRAPSERARLLPAGTKILAQCLTCTAESVLDGVKGCDAPRP